MSARVCLSMCEREGKLLYFWNIHLVLAVLDARKDQHPEKSALDQDKVVHVEHLL